jgi:mutator protein MutT
MTDTIHRQLVVSVGIVERSGTFLLIRRVAPHHERWHLRWEFPGGKIAPGETPLEALHREVYEETSLKITEPKLLGVHTHNWEIPNGVQQTFILLYHCHSHEGDVVLNPAENDAYCWSTLEEIAAKEGLLDGILTMLDRFWKK